MLRPVTCPKNASQHPGQVVLEGIQKQCTAEQKQANDALAEQEKKNQEATCGHAAECLTNIMVSSMQEEEESNTQHPRPRPHVLLRVTKPDLKEGSQGTECSQTLVPASPGLDAETEGVGLEGWSIDNDGTLFEGNSGHTTTQAATAAAPEDSTSHNRDITKLAKQGSGVTTTFQKRKPESVLLTETVLFYWNFHNESYQQSQNEAKEGHAGIGKVKDWADNSFHKYWQSAHKGRRTTPASMHSSTHASTPMKAGSQVPVSFVEEDSVPMLEPQWGSQHRAIQARQMITDIISESEPEEEEEPSQQVLKDEAVDEDKALIVPPPSKRSQISASQRTGSGANNKYINTNLPLGARANNKWRRVYLSMLAHVISAYENPWSIPDDVFLVILQKVWDVVYKLSVLHTVETGGPVHHISKQALTNWRAGFASAAVVTITSFFSNNVEFEEHESRAEFAEAMLEDHRFLFSDNKGIDPAEWKGIWKSPFVLQTFAHHFNYIQGHVDVSDLPFQQLGPRGALALACAVVACFLTLVMNNNVEFKAAESLDAWSSCIPKGTQYEFNEGVWGATTLYYLKPILRLSDQQFQPIMDDTQRFVKAMRAIPCWATDPMNINDDESDKLFAFR